MHMCWWAAGGRIISPHLIEGTPWFEGSLRGWESPEHSQTWIISPIPTNSTVKGRRNPTGFQWLGNPQRWTHPGQHIRQTCEESLIPSPGCSLQENTAWYKKGWGRSSKPHWLQTETPSIFPFWRESARNHRHLEKGRGRLPIARHSPVHWTGLTLQEWIFWMWEGIVVYVCGGEWASRHS